MTMAKRPRDKVITQARMERLINQAAKKTERTMFIMSVCAAAMALHDDFGFGPARLDRFVTAIMRKINDFDEGLYSATDAAQWLEDYAGIKMREVLSDGTVRQI